MTNVNDNGNDIDNDNEDENENENKMINLVFLIYLQNFVVLFENSSIVSFDFSRMEKIITLAFANFACIFP